jgi:hypothetical protein
MEKIKFKRAKLHITRTTTTLPLLIENYSGRSTPRLREKLIFHSSAGRCVVVRHVMPTAYKRKMDYDPKEICYLCGSQLGLTDVNLDHVFQQQFVTRNQPKEKGFDYAGVLPVHVGCNKKFGTGNQAPEAICGKALRLLEVLQRDDTLKVIRDNPNFRVAAINSSWFLNFSQQDIDYFKLIDLTNVAYEDWAHGNHLADKQMINPFQIPINVALSTLAKSTAGFLVKRHGVAGNTHWRILALPFYAQDNDFDFDRLFGKVQPLEVGIKLWIKSDRNSWLAGYKHNRLFVIFCIEFAASDTFRQIKAQLNSVWKDFSCLFFDSDKLIDLVGYHWSKNEYPL